MVLSDQRHKSHGGCLFSCVTSWQFCLLGMKCRSLSDAKTSDTLSDDQKKTEEALGRFNAATML